MSSNFEVAFGTVIALLVSSMLLSTDSSLYGDFGGLLKFVGVITLVFSVKIGKWLSTL